MMKKIDIISASAGSGKTYRLAECLEHAILTDEARPEAVVATTFTRKAAAELYERVRVRLLNAGRTDEAHRLNAARIGTVNSVCGRLLQDFAFELGVSPELTVLDEEQSREALRRSIAYVVTSSETEDLEELHERLEELKWQDRVYDIVNLARINLIDVNNLEKCKERSIESFERLVDNDRTEDGGTLEEHLRGSLDQFVRGIEQNGDRAKKTAECLVVVKESLSRMRSGRKLSWRAWAKLANLDVAVLSREFAAAVGIFAAKYDRHPGFLDDIIRTTTLVFDISIRAIKAYEGYKQKWALLDFVDQEVLALELLRREDIRKRLRNEIDLVLVDEFQDTSPIQLAIFLQLAELANRSVWVGDQKQSIFGFRGTDPALMDAAIDAVLEGKKPQTLDISYRSRSELVAITSDLFAPAFARHGIPEERIRLKPADDQEPQGMGSSIERWRWKARNKEGDALALAAAIKQFLEDPSVVVRDKVTKELRHIQRRDFAILCFANETCRTVADALERAGIRAVVPRIGLMSTHEASLIRAGLRLWLNAGDTLAMAELARLTDDPADGDEWFRKLIEKTCYQAFSNSKTISNLKKARGDNPQLGAIAALDAVMEAVEAREQCLKWGDADERIGNLDALRSQAVLFSETCADQGMGCTVAGLLGHFDSLAECKEDSQAVLSSADAVVVSTLHSAKGLEWPVTVLFKIDSSREEFGLDVHAIQDSGKIDLSNPLAERWIRYWPNPYNWRQSKTALHQRLREHRASSSASDSAVQDQRQDLRLLYVGWTRARDCLVLAGRENVFTNGKLGLLNDGENILISEPGENTKWAGHELNVRIRETTPEPVNERQPEPGSGYTPSGPKEHPPTILNPSLLEMCGEIREVIKLGPRMHLTGSPNMDDLGHAVHAFLAADNNSMQAEARVSMAERLLQRWGVASALEPQAVVKASDTLKAWILSQWPSARWHREWPIQQKLPNGSVVRGNTDLALETEDAFILIDHKTFPGSEEEAIKRASSYTGQMNAYAAAIKTATGKQVQAMYIHLPILGLVIEVD